MPNPLFGIQTKKGKKFAKKLTPKQKAIVRRLRGAGLKNKNIKFYRRAGNRSGVSVHDPFQDFAKDARSNTKSAKKYPQAFDTSAQARGSKSFKSVLTKKSKIKKNNKLFLP